ncbi:MAG: hypothetical protein QNJ72_39475 [Pleurocapsa sp. MO_226.B13]|nr:hypothetical protein [Pleurocapsa sp. MO_226.B13]
MIFLFSGNDKILIEQQIEHILSQYQLSKYSKFEDSKEAYLRCLTISLLTKVTATVIELPQVQLDLDISMVSRLHKSKNLLFIVCPSFNSRTKLGEALKPYLVSNSSLPNNWNKQGIKQAIDFYARQFGLNLTPEVKAYLHLALNNNFSLLRSGLDSLALLSTNPPLDLVKEVVPDLYATAIDLKQLILQRKRGEIKSYVTKLRAFAHDQVILASLGTQFTMLMQTAIGIQQNLSDTDIAKLAGIKNVKRLYFLRQELEHISIEQLIWLNRSIKDTQRQLNYNTCDLTARLMMMCCW